MKMSYWSNVEIDELELKIPKKDFPLKSDLIVGFEYPRLIIQEDEGSDGQTNWAQDYGDYWLFKGGFYGRYNYETCVDELKELCLKYNGTLIAKEVGEDGETSYTRVRNGKEKKVRIIEED